MKHILLVAARCKKVETSQTEPRFRRSRTNITCSWHRNKRKYAVYVLKPHSFKKVRDSFHSFYVHTIWVDYSKLTKLLPIIKCSSSCSSHASNVFAVATFVCRSLWQTLSLWIVWIVGHIWIAYYSFGFRLPSIQLPIQCSIRMSYIQCMHPTVTKFLLIYTPLLSVWKLGFPGDCLP